MKFFKKMLLGSMVLVVLTLVAHLNAMNHSEFIKQEKLNKLSDEQKLDELIQKEEASMQNILDAFNESSDEYQGFLWMQEQGARQRRQNVNHNIINNNNNNQLILNQQHRNLIQAHNAPLNPRTPLSFRIFSHANSFNMRLQMISGIKFLVFDCLIARFTGESALLDEGLLRLLEISGVIVFIAGVWYFIKLVPRQNYNISAICINSIPLILPLLMSGSGTFSLVKRIYKK